jgi:hypothetical protein
MLHTRLLTALLILPLAAGCGGSDDSAASDDADRGPANVLEAVDAARAAAQAMSENSERRSPPLDPEELRDRMPETVAGLPRVDLTVASGGMGGVAGTTVHARYQNDERDYVEITLVDLSATPGMAAASAAWSTMTFDRTTQNGFERTTRFEGFPAMESEMVESGVLRSELNVLAGTFTLHLEGRQVDLETLHELAGQLRLGGLAR